MEVKKYAEKSEKRKVKIILIGILAGIAVGFVNGFFGAGGGMLAVPALTLILSTNEKKAHATALLIILPLSILSGIIYAGSVTVGSFFPLVLAGVIVGGIIGAVLLKKLSTASLIVSFYMLMAFAGFQMLR